MKKKKITLAKGVTISFIALVLGALALNSWARNQQDSNDSVLVIVDGVEITKNEVEKKLEALLGPRAKMMPPEKLAEIRNQLQERVIDSMIDEMLLTKAVQNHNTTVGDEEVEAVLKQMQTSLPPGTTFEGYLKDMGLTKDNVRQSVSKNLRIRKFLEQKTSDLAAPSQKEIDVYYAENSEKFQMPESIEARHILIAVKPDEENGVKSEKMKKAQEIRKQLVDKKGENFAAVAAEKSDCPSKAKGGQLGVLYRGQTVKPFENAAFSQKIGEIGPVVETNFGYHIIEVLSHKEAGKVPISDVSDYISNKLISEKKEKAVREYIGSLKAGASIVFQGEESEERNPA